MRVDKRNNFTTCEIAHYAVVSTNMSMSVGSMCVDMRSPFTTWQITDYASMGTSTNPNMSMHMNISDTHVTQDFLTEA